VAYITKDRVKETTTTTGTGTYTLAGAETGFQAFSVVGNTNTCDYGVTDGTDWEIVRGTYTTSGTTLSRDSIHDSSNGGAAVDWGAGSKDVFLVLPASQAGDPFTRSDLIATATAGIGGVGTPSSSILAVGDVESVLVTGQGLGLVYDVTDTASNTYAALSFTARFDHSSQTAATLRGIHFQAGTTSGVTTNVTGAVDGVYGGVRHRGTGVMSNTSGINIAAISRTSTGTITNNYGLLINRQEQSWVTDAWGIYQSDYSGTARVYLGGALGVGDTDPAQKAVVDGFIGVGTGLTSPSTGDLGVVFGESAVDVTPSGSSCAIYAKEDFGSAELFAVDEMGMYTQLTPHPAEIMLSHTDKAVDLGVVPLLQTWAAATDNMFTGIRTTCDMGLAMLVLEKLYKQVFGEEVELVEEMQSTPVDSWEDKEDRAQAHSEEVRNKVLARHVDNASRYREWLKNPLMSGEPTLSEVTSIPNLRTRKSKPAQLGD